MKTPKVDIEFIRSWADVGDWDEIDYQPNILMVSFRKKYIRVNVFISTGTVVIARHKRQKVLKKQTQEQIADLLHEL